MLVDVYFYSLAGRKLVSAIHKLFVVPDFHQTFFADVAKGMIRIEVLAAQYYITL